MQARPTRPIRRRGGRGVAAAALLALGVVAAAPRATRADTRADLDRGSFEVDRERTRSQRILIASLGGGALLFGAVGALLHLDSQDKADEVSLKGPHSGRVYDAEVDSTRRAALRSRGLTIAAYGVGGGLLIATLVVYLVTDPGTETIQLAGAARGARLRPRATPTVVPALVPLDGGGLVAGRWTF